MLKAEPEKPKGKRSMEYAEAWDGLDHMDTEESDEEVATKKPKENAMQTPLPPPGTVLFSTEVEAMAVQLTEEEENGSSKPSPLVWEKMAADRVKAAKRKVLEEKAASEAKSKAEEAAKKKKAEYEKTLPNKQKAAMARAKAQKAGTSATTPDYLLEATFPGHHARCLTEKGQRVSLGVKDDVLLILWQAKEQSEADVDKLRTRPWVNSFGSEEEEMLLASVLQVMKLEGGQVKLCLKEGALKATLDKRATEQEKSFWNKVTAVSGAHDKAGGSLPAIISQQNV